MRSLTKGFVAMRHDIPYEAKVQEQGQHVWWNPAEWPAGVAFLIGMPVGFLFRPVQPPERLVEPVPLYFSLWGAWWVPVVVLGGLMWLKLAAVLFQQRRWPAFWPVASAHLAWLAGLFALFCGIAPLDTLQQLGLNGDFASLPYFLLNPLAVGLAVAFIFVPVSQPGSRAGRGIWLALLAWLGTLACFLMLLTLYLHVVSQQLLYEPCRGLCLSNSPTLIFNTWYIWVPIGLILATLGGFVGVVLCSVTLGQRGT
jgi:hypothetical protein